MSPQKGSHPETYVLMCQWEMLLREAGHPSPLGPRAGHPYSNPSLRHRTSNSAQIPRLCLQRPTPFILNYHWPGGHLFCGHSATVPGAGRSILRPLATSAEWTMSCSGLCWGWCLLSGPYLLHGMEQLLPLEYQELYLSPAWDPLSQTSCMKQRRVSFCFRGDVGG